jgi:hypothetical protein
VEERGDGDDVKEELVAGGLAIEVGRLDHVVEPVEELKKEDALLRSLAEPTEEVGRCAVQESDAPMLFWRSRSNVRW